jgi:alkylated DNA repair protein (DNA oxidative demethylase)
VNDTFTPRHTGPRREIAPGAHHVPGWLTLSQQAFIVEQFKEWASGPVPLHSPKVRGHEMSVELLCLGWHWQPYKYTRVATDVNGQPVAPLPQWLIELGQQALNDASPHLGDGAEYLPDTALVNYYRHGACMGMHQDKDEASLAPVVSLSIGDTCQFRFGNTTTRNKPHQDLELASGDLFVFGGPSRLAFHGVTKIIPGTAPQGCGLTAGRINVTLRMTGIA